MGKKQLLSQRERGKIDAYLSLGISKRTIARRLRRSVTCVTTYVRDGAEYGRNYRGASRKLTSRDIRRVTNIARNKQISAKAIKSELELQVSLSTIRRTLKNNQIQYTKMKCQPRLSSRHKTQRLEFCHETMSRDWRKLCSPMKKNLTLTDPTALRTIGMIYGAN